MAQERSVPSKKEILEYIKDQIIQRGFPPAV